MTQRGRFLVRCPAFPRIPLRAKSLPVPATGDRGNNPCRGQKMTSSRSRAQTYLKVPSLPESRPDGTRCFDGG